MVLREGPIHRGLATSRRIEKGLKMNFATEPHAVHAFKEFETGNNVAVKQRRP
jgi:hypothetical protein